MFQLSDEFERLTEFDIHKKFSKKLPVYARNILNGDCTLPKENFDFVKMKTALARRKEEKAYNLLIAFDSNSRRMSLFLVSCYFYMYLTPRKPRCCQCFF